MKRDLWLRLKRYHFDALVPSHLTDRVAAAFGGTDASTKAFASKIARKLSWTPRFALHAIEEYKKFVYLGIVSDFSVTPPKVIDQVWHEHLLFSRGYREFCRDVLTRDFDHNPELLPSSEQTSVFQAQYEETLARYTGEFNVVPPVDVWGTPKFALTTVPARKVRRHADTPLSYADDTPLFMYFDGSPVCDGLSFDTMAEFGGGGGFSGGGAETSWGDSTSSEGAASDSGSSSDGGSSCSSGSGCSSSCGGGE